jgi:hypothetical protein
MGYARWPGSHLGSQLRPDVDTVFTVLRKCRESEIVSLVASASPLSEPKEHPT